MLAPNDQQVTEQNAGRDALAMAFGLQPSVPRTGAAEPAAQPVTNGAELANAQAPTAADVTASQPAAPATPAAPEIPAIEAPATADPYAAVVEAMLPTEAAPVTWNPESLNAFKGVFGAEDPVAYKADIEAKLTAAELLKAEHDKVTPIVQAINGLPPAFQKALSLATEGKLAEAQQYLRELPSGVFQNKASKDIPQQDLVEQRFPGKIKPEQWAMLKDPEADPDMVDALKTRINILHESAAELHDKELEGIVKTQAQVEAENKARYEKYQAATASTISLAKNSPFAKVLDQGTIDRITTGQFLADFVEADGVTPKPEAATLYLWAKHGQKAVVAAETRGYNRGKSEGLQQATQRQPSLPPSQNRSTGDTPANPTDEDRMRSIVLGALTRN